MLSSLSWKLFGQPNEPLSQDILQYWFTSFLINKLISTSGNRVRSRKELERIFAEMWKEIRRNDHYFASEILLLVNRMH